MYWELCVAVRYLAWGCWSLYRLCRRIEPSAVGGAVKGLLVTPEGVQRSSLQTMVYSLKEITVCGVETRVVGGLRTAPRLCWLLLCRIFQTPCLFVKLCYAVLSPAPKTVCYFPIPSPAVLTVHYRFRDCTAVLHPPPWQFFLGPLFTSCFR